MFENHENIETQGVLQAEAAFEEIFNTSSPTLMPVAAPSGSKYDHQDRDFIGAYIIFPFSFAAATGALSGYISHLNEEIFNSVKYQLVTKGALFVGSIAAAVTSLFSGEDNVSAENHLAAVAWILVSTAGVFYTVEKGVKLTLNGRIHEL
jgi:hypothetical protein